jgi:hypothetical protein
MIPAKMQKWDQHVDETCYKYNPIT